MEEWLQQQITELDRQANSYEDRALLQETKKIIEEIKERTIQLQGEIDGRSWNHRDW